MQGIKYRIKWSKFVKITTIVLSLILSLTEALIIVIFYKHSQNWSDALWCIGLFIIILIITACTIAFTPLSLTLTETDLILMRPIGRRIFPLKDINDVGTYTSDLSEVRLFGSGGFYGFIGVYFNIKFGRYIAYVGDFSEAFYITTNSRKKKYVLSCEDRDSIISLIKNGVI